MARTVYFFLAPLKFDFFRIFFIGLKWSLGIFRKSQKVSALSFDHKGAKIGDMSIAGPYGPPPLCGIGLSRDLACGIECGKSVSHINRLGEHMKYVHGKDERHGCEMCADALSRRRY